MPWLDKPNGKLKTFEIKKDEGGNIMFEAEDPNIAVQRHLRPDTGTETAEQWPTVAEEDAPAPLLDLEKAWEQAVKGLSIEVPEGEKNIEGSTVQYRNAAILVREYRYHLLATTAGAHKQVRPDSGNTESEEKETDVGAFEAEAEAPVNFSIGVKPTDDTEKVQVADVDYLKSLYGASILLKLQWEDRAAQKAIPQRSYEELALFISGITQKVESTLKSNPEAGQKVVDAFGLELTSVVFCRYLEGVETCTVVLEECCFELLKLLAEVAVPKEMHIALKLFVGKIDRVYIEAFSYLVLCPLVILWGRVITRMEVKRHVFLVDLFKVLDRMVINADSFEIGFVPDDGVGVEKPGRTKNLPELTLQLLENITTVQIKQRDSDPSIKVQVDVLGRDIASSLNVSSEVANEHGHGKAETDSSSKTVDITTDWVNERAATLAKLLSLQATLWSRLPLPRGEERNVPIHKSKIQNRQKAQLCSDVEANERALARCLNLFYNLGWTNPVLVCQVAANGMCLDCADQDSELMKKHIGEDLRSKKEKKNSLYSVTSVGLYICGVLRAGSRGRMSGTSVVEDDVDDYEVILSGTAFEMITPQYAFDLALPYLMTLVPQTNVCFAISAIMTIRKFLDQITDGAFESIDDILRLRCGTNAMGREANIPGLAYHLVKAVGFFEDPGHRRIAYETLQVVLRKCSSPTARFVILEGIFAECTRVAVAAQIMNEMKQVLVYADECAFKARGDASKLKESSHLRSRFADDCFPRYFTPRKELLVSMNAIATASGLLFFLARRDKILLGEIKNDHEDVRIETKKRLKFCKEYGKLGKILVRALASVAEHDRKTVPDSSLARKSRDDAQALYLAAGKTLNQCVSSLMFLDCALEDYEAVGI